MDQVDGSGTAAESAKVPTPNPEGFGRSNRSCLKLRRAGAGGGRKSAEPNCPTLQGSALYADARTENAVLIPDIAARWGTGTRV
jgi:hypothetical protein